MSRATDEHAEQLKQYFEFSSPDNIIQVDHPLQLLIFFPNEEAHYQTKNVVDMAIAKSVSDSVVQGTLVLTNLRLIFTLDSDKSINATIGYGCISYINVGNMRYGSDVSKMAATKISQVNTLVLLCKYKEEQYRFEFLPRGSRVIFDVIYQLYRAYDTSKLYRRLRVRYILQPNRYFQAEEICSATYYNTVLLSALSPVSVVGVLYLTTFRIFWHAAGQPYLNISLPYLCVLGLYVKGWQFAKNEPEEPALLVQANSGQKNMVMAFKVVGVRAEDLYLQLLELCQQAMRNPNYGIKIRPDKAADVIDQGFEKQFEQKRDTTGKISQIIRGVDRVAEYLQAREENREIFFAEQYGLAFEKIGGVSLEELWSM